MALRRFFITPEMIQAPQPELTGSDAVHLCRVLRMAAGSAIELFDGTGQGYRARILEVSPKRVRLRIEASFSLASESPVHITLAQGMLKDRKMDDLIRQATELGIDCWMPFYAARSVPSPGRKGMDGRLARWEKIAIEAVKQCRRARIPRLMPADNFSAVIAATAACDLKVLFWEEANQAVGIPGQAAKRIVVTVGPEGGFDEAEVRQARAHGFLTTGLGPRILRAETAALAACALVQYRFGDMG